MSFLSFLDPSRGYRKAMDQYKQAYGQAQQQLQPYQQAGQQMIPTLQSSMQQLMDPNSYNQLAAGYEESPYAKWLQQHSMEQGLDAASSMGLLGSSTALQGIQANAANIAQSQRQQYLDSLNQRYMAGLGVGQNMYGVGAGAAGQGAGQAMQYGDQMGQAAYGRANAPLSMLGSMGNLAAQAALAYATGGLSIPASAAMNKKGAVGEDYSSYPYGYRPYHAGYPALARY